MKQNILLFIIFIFSCTHTGYPKAENDLDAGREFIDAVLKGDFDKAGFYSLKGESDAGLLQQLKTAYQEKSNEDKHQLHDAVITILKVENISKSETILHYKNSFDNKEHQLKIVLKDGNWLAEIKDAFNGSL
jgi:hypothetical protein